MLVRRLCAADAIAFQALRLRGLQECPAAFAASHEEEVATPVDQVAARLDDRPDGAVFGAFDGDTLCAIVGVQREALSKLAHKAFVWGLYVAPESRQRGLGGALLQRALVFAAESLGVRQVNLGVNTLNEAALALYRQTGFRAFGVERGCLLVDGVPHDEIQMARAVAVPQQDRPDVAPAALPSRLRVARPVGDIARSREMYCRGLGLKVLGSFEDHDGFDGVMLGAAGADHHFEFTHCRRHPVAPAPTTEDLVVFYLPAAADWQRACADMLAAGFEAVISFNPYWDVHGRTFVDLDGYRVVLQNAAWREADPG